MLSSCPSWETAHLGTHAYSKNAARTHACLHALTHKQTNTRTQRRTLVLLCALRSQEFSLVHVYFTHLLSWEAVSVSVEHFLFLHLVRFFDTDHDVMSVARVPAWSPSSPTTAPDQLRPKHDHLSVKHSHVDKRTDYKTKIEPTY